MDDGLSAADDTALIDAFNLACARYPRGWDAAVPVENADDANVGRPGFETLP